MFDMSEIMESSSNAHHRRKSKFKFTSFPDYVRKVQQLSFSQSQGQPMVTTDAADSDGCKAMQAGSKKQNLSRAFSCFSTSSTSPNLPYKTPDHATACKKQQKLPPLRRSGGTEQVKDLQLNLSISQETTSSSPLRPIEQLKSQEIPMYRASSFPLVSDSSSGDDKATPGSSQNVSGTKCKRQMMNKSPYLQPLVRKSYYHTVTGSVGNCLKAQRKKKVKQQCNTANLSHDTSVVHSKGEETNLSIVDSTSLLIPSITLRAATPSANSDEMSTSLLDQFTARRQLAAELDKLNKEIQDIVVSVGQVGEQ